VPKKDVSLEAIRGIASISVLLWHCMKGFYPAIIDDDQARTLHGMPGFAFLNGASAVTLFFVLSGYVLTRRYFATYDRDIIARGIVKRWPRLAGPVLISTVLSWVLFVTGAYKFQSAGALNGSRWLATLAIPDSYPHASLSRAVSQGLLTFFKGTSTFDGVLWTMQPEFIGSIIAFGLALLMPLMQSRAPKVIVFVVVGLMCHFNNQPLAAFPVGVALAYFLPRSISLPARLTALQLIFALYLLGYLRYNVGIYSPLAVWDGFSQFSIYLQIIGAALLIATVETSTPITAVLSTKFFALLGELSFPLYLVHTLVICSIGSTIIVLYGANSLTAIISSAVCIAASIAAAVPVLLFNRRWLGFVNRSTTRLFQVPVRPADSKIG
jgi:peptidoglycan/LPS O-acetylase OafA/YrhL